MDPMIGKKIEPYEIQEILALLETPDGICIVMEDETWEESKLNGVEGTWFAIRKND